MQRRPLGSSGLSVPPLCLGGNVFGWTADATASFAVLDAALDAGLDFIDTADSYSRWAPGHSGGESETIIGDWMAARRNRDKVILATKVGSDMGEGRKGLKAAYIAASVEGSLKRLKTDRIDLYQSHYDDLDTPVEETLEAYGRLIAAGKVRAIGASNFTPARLRESLAASARDGLPRYESLQPEYNLYARAGYETDYEPIAVEFGLGVIPYYALAAGFLSGKYRSEADFGKSARGAGMAKYLDARGLGILAALDAVAAAHGATQAQVAIAWLIARPSVTAPIASATSTAQVADLAAATRLTLTADDVARLDAASA